MLLEQPEFDLDIPLERSQFISWCEYFKIDFTKAWADQLGKALFLWGKSKISKPIKVLSLFSGAGGLDIGFRDVGFEIVQAVELEEKFSETLRANVYQEGTKVECIDIRKYKPPKGLSIDFVIGGPPCQTFSAAGRRAAGVQGIEDERGMLFREYVRILEKLDPKGFLFENVYGIKGAQEGKAFELILKGFKDAGYHVTWRVLDAADYGVPQHRERMIIVGSKKKGFFFPRPTHGPDSPGQISQVSAKQALQNVNTGDEKIISGINGRFGHLLSDIPPGLNYSYFTQKMGHPRPIFAWRSKFSDFLYKADPNVPIRTLKAQGGQYTGPFHWDSRPFTVAELKRLQTFPDDYVIVGGRQTAIHQIGNSVPPQLSRVLASQVLLQFFGIEQPVKLPLLRESEVLTFRKRKRNRTFQYSEKAKNSISKIKKAKQISFRASKSRYVLDSGFVLREDEKGLPVSIKPKKNWLEIKAETKRKSKFFKIEIFQTEGIKWNLPFEKIVLSGTILDERAFIICWKILEKEIARNGRKADLVQLSGYYQYLPGIRCIMTLPDQKNHRWNSLAKVVEGKGVRTMLTAEDSRELWELKKSEDILQFAKWMRTLGYEIRNSSTNPQIPDGVFLIPYCFPTLNSLSVQLGKSL